MASTLCRAIAGFTRRVITSPSLTTVRHSGTTGGPTDPDYNFKGKVEISDTEMPSDLGHTVGFERYEMLQNIQGDMDPFEFNTHLLLEKEGTRENPVMVPSQADERLVGCLCDDTVMSISWMQLFEGEAKRCECGFWFKMQRVEVRV